MLPVISPVLLAETREEVATYSVPSTPSSFV